MKNRVFACSAFLLTLSVCAFAQESARHVSQRVPVANPTMELSAERVSDFAHANETAQSARPRKIRGRSSQPFPAL